MDTTQNRFFIYARKSTDDLSRQVRSIDDQIAELWELAKRENLDVADTLIEKQTAKVPGRPVFNGMLERIERGEAKGILAWHPDRLARNSLDGGRIIHLVDTGGIADLKFPTFMFDPTATGKFMLAIMFGQSKYYVDNLSENIKRGQRQKLKSGIWPMVAPVGYLNDRATKTIYPDPDRAPLVRKAFEVFATGTCTVDRLCKEMELLGLVNRRGETLSRTQFHRLLRNPLYCGIIRYGGEDHEGRHEPIITKKLFDSVQELISRRSRIKAPKLKPYLYRGMFRCGECRAFITTETQKGHNYLRCTKRVKRDCSQPFVREESIATEITEQIRRMALPSQSADWMIGELEAERERDTESRQDCLRSMRSRINEIDQKQERLMQAYLDKALSLEEFRLGKAKLVEEKQELKDNLTGLEDRQGSWFEPAIRFVKASKQAVFLAESGSDEEKRDFLQKHGSNLKIQDRHLSVVPRKPWELVVDQGPFAHDNAALSSSAASCLGEISPHLNLAEEVRFELTRPLRAYRFSRPAHSTTLPLLQNAIVPRKSAAFSVLSGGFRNATGWACTSPDSDGPR